MRSFKSPYQQTCLALILFCIASSTPSIGQDTTVAKPEAIRKIDLASRTDLQVVVDRETGQYLGHPTSCLLPDGKTIVCVYPKGHGKGPITMKRSTDGGITWSERLPTPDNWSTSLETPTIHRVVDAAGVARHILWSGLYPARLSVSLDECKTWTPLKAAGNWGGIVVMGSVVALKTPGHYIALFHDDGRYFRQDSKQSKPIVFSLLQSKSTDGGLTWSDPTSIYTSSDVHLCEPGAIRSPDGNQIAVLLRENRRVKHSHLILSNDEAEHWTAPVELPELLTGDRHTAVYTDDGRLFISFRDMAPNSEWKGDWVAWVGTYEDIIQLRPGQLKIRLMDNHKGFDCAYPGVEKLPDGTIVTTSYGHFTPNESPYIVSVRLPKSLLNP